jgi:predicted RNase H-like HicB family nuclease
MENIVMQTFRCFVRESRRENAFYAVCIDLNLVDRRESVDEAIAAMIENIESYFETAYEHNEADKLIPRPAPFVDQLYYRWLLIKSFFASSRKALSTHLFSVPVKRERLLYVRPPLSPAHA